MNFIKEIILGLFNNKKIALAVKIGFLICLFYVLYLQISDAKLSFSRALILEPTVYESILAVVGYSFLLFINYSCEIKKWQLLAQEVEPRPFFSAGKDVLIGLFMGVLSPFMIGDFLGRSISFKGIKKKQMVYLNLFNSVSQTYVAIAMGAFSLVLWKEFIGLGFSKSHQLFLYLMLIAVVLGLVFVIKINFDFLNRIKIIESFIGVYNKISNGLRVQIVMLTLLRNMVFIAQYLLVFWILNLRFELIEVFIGVNLIMLAKTVVGGINILGDFSVRQIIGVYFFGILGYDLNLVFLASFIIWFLNVFIPALLGYWALNINSKKNVGY